MKTLVNVIVPQTLRSGGVVRERYKLIWNLLCTYGWLQTVKKKKCINASNQPIPWFTYPAIDYLSQLDLSSKEVFEFGSGYSTLFWSKRVKSVIAVESFEEWNEKIKKEIGSNVTLLLSSNDRHDYANQI